jgi:hypothetical protein
LIQPFVTGVIQSVCITVFGSVPALYSAKIWSKSPLTALSVAVNKTPLNWVNAGLHVVVPVGLQGVTLPGGRVEFQPENSANNVNWARLRFDNAGAVVDNTGLLGDNSVGAVD